MKPSPALPGPTAPAPTSIRERLRQRTRELALRAGRTALQVSQLDYEQAKREITGESDPACQDAVLSTFDPPHTRGAPGPA
jgi:hypothetical protein